jgi:hypothetical protein
LRLASGLTQPRRHEKHQQYVYCDVDAEYKICIATGGSAK